MNAHHPLRAIGEEGAWKIMQPYVAASGISGVLTGFGDDAASVVAAANEQLLLTTDMLVEGVHFLREIISWKDLGHKAIAVNVSDIAAMGGRPTYALVSIGLPAEFAASDLKAFYQGMAAEVKAAGAVLCGGDTVRSANVVINITLLGTAPARRKLPLRSDCHPGQNLYATGTLGDSAAGLALLTHPEWQKLRNENWANRLVKAHIRPSARLKAGQALAAAFKDLAMIDISDGLVHECRLLASASEVTIDLHVPNLPLSNALHAFARTTGEDAFQYACAGGEDYELLFSTKAAPNKVNDLLKSLKTGTAATKIGTIIEGTPKVTSSEYDLKQLKPFEHFI